MHVEDDSWSPKVYALEVLKELGARNVECGFPRERLTLLPAGSGGRKGHVYEDKAIWDAKLLKELLLLASNEAGNGGVRRRRLPALRGSVSQVQGSSVPMPRGSVGQMFPPTSAGDEGDGGLVGPAPSSPVEAGGAEDSEEAVRQPWTDEDISEGGWEDSEEEEKALLKEDGEEIPEEEDAVLEDARSASFQGGLEEAPSDWRAFSSFSMESFEVQAETFDEDDPSIPIWASYAADVFREQGFVIILGALTPKAAKTVLKDCQATAEKIVRPETLAGNRHGGARYSFGNASSTRSLFHLRSFARHLLDNRMILKVLDAIFAESDPASAETDSSSQAAGGFSCVSAGGDFVMPRERRFQSIHDDLGVAKKDNVLLPPPLVSTAIGLGELLRAADHWREWAHACGAIHAVGSRTLGRVSARASGLDGAASLPVASWGCDRARCAHPSCG